MHVHGCVAFSQMQSFAAPPSLYPEELKLDVLYMFARLDLGKLPSLSLSVQEQLYWSFGVSMLICAMWNGLALALVCGLNGYCGLKMKDVAKFDMLNTVVGLLSNSAYLIVLPQLLSMFECVKVVKGGSFLLRSTLNEAAVAAITTGGASEVPTDAIVCWEGVHSWLALFAMTTLVDYCLSCMMVSPFFLEDYTGVCVCLWLCVCRCVCAGVWLR